MCPEDLCMCSESEGLMDEARRVVEDALDNVCQTKHITDWGKIKNTGKRCSE